MSLSHHHHCWASWDGGKAGVEKKKVKTYLFPGAGMLASKVNIGVRVCSAN